MQLSEAVKLTPPKILLYGAPGTWKTTTALTWGEQTEVIDVDKKLLSAVRVQDKFTPERQKVEVTGCYDINPLAPAAFEKAKTRIYEISNQAATGGYKKKVLVLDSLTSFGDHAMRMVLRNTGKIRQVATGQTPLTTMQEWGLAINEVENCLTVLKSLPVVVIVIAHELTEVVDDVVKTKIWAIGNKLPNKLPVGFDEIWYSKIIGAGGDRHAVLQTQASSVVACTRGGLPDNWDTRLGIQEAMKTIGYT